MYKSRPSFETRPWCPLKLALASGGRAAVREVRVAAPPDRHGDSDVKNAVRP